MITKGVNKLDVHEDVLHQKLEWRIEYVSWILLLLTLLAALLGLLGPGPLSRFKIRSPDQLVTVEYARIQRYESPMVLRIQVSSDAIQDGKIRLNVGNQFVECVHITRIDPEPEAVIAGEKFFTFVFEAEPNDEPTKIHFHHEPNEFGRMLLEVGVDRQKLAKRDVIILP